jgi:Lon protease-like protein
MAKALPDPLPLFPLQTVLYPGGVLPLKIFEARYLDLVSRCLRTGQPFGVVCLTEGREAGGARGANRFAPEGTLAHIAQADSPQTGILLIRCIGGMRFELREQATQAADGLWCAPAVTVEDDTPTAIPAELEASAQELARVARLLADKGGSPLGEPWLLDDAGWVANRWCEMLPIPLSVRQQLLMEPLPLKRLAFVDGLLRAEGLIRKR